MDVRVITQLLEQLARRVRQSQCSPDSLDSCLYMNMNMRCNSRAKKRKEREGASNDESGAFPTETLTQRDAPHPPDKKERIELLGL